jgi:hypothetical protein
MPKGKNKWNMLVTGLFLIISYILFHLVQAVNFIITIFPIVATSHVSTAVPEQPPNQILFLTNLPDETNEMMLSMLFNQ